MARRKGYAEIRATIADDARRHDWPEARAWRVKVAGYHREDSLAHSDDARQERTFAAIYGSPMARKAARQDAAWARHYARLAGYFTPTSLLSNGKARRHA